jgi:chitin synthase
MLLRNLCDISKTSEKKSKTHSLLLKIDPILSAFGHATTPHNLDATCFTHYTELQFNSKGKMVGAKLIEYLLEKTRVSGPLDGGRNFHIFYYLLEGANHEERVQWHLSDVAHFNYLTGSNIVG